MDWNRAVLAFLCRYQAAGGRGGPAAGLRAPLPAPKTLLQLLDRCSDVSGLLMDRLNARSRVTALLLLPTLHLELDQAAFDRLLWSTGSPAQATRLARRLGHPHLHGQNPILAAGEQGWGGDPDAPEAFCTRAFRTGGRRELLAWARANGCPWAEWVSHTVTALTVPDGVFAIAGGAFRGCSRLRSVTLPPSLEALGDEAFRGCRALGPIALPPSLETLGHRAFQGCRALHALVLPDGIRELRNSAFRDCASLHTVFLPAGLYWVSPTAFDRCGRLRAVWAQGDPPADLVRDVEAALDTGAAVRRTRQLAELDQPAFDRLLWSTANPAEALRLAELLGHEELHPRNPILAAGFLGGWQTTMMAADYCARALREGNLELLAWAGANGCPWPTAVRDRVTTLIVPDGVFHIRSPSAYSNCARLISVVLPPSLAALGDSTFSNCRALTTVVLPPDLTALGAQTFSGCHALTEIRLPDGLTALGDYTFWGCHALTEIGLPDGLTALGEGTFMFCHALRSVAVPAGVRELGDGTFQHCRRLSAVTLLPGLTALGNHTFRGCRALPEIVIPDSVETLGHSTFMDCTTLHTVVLPAGLRSIEPTVFYGCDALRSVYFPRLPLHMIRAILDSLPDGASLFPRPPTGAR